MVESSELGDASTPLLSKADRKRVLSATRLKLTLTVFVVTILLALSAMIFSGVSQIFDWLTPSIRADLVHKTQRGAVELADAAQIGIVVRVHADIAAAAQEYLDDDDVVAISAQDGKGATLFAHGHAPAAVGIVLASKPNTLIDLEDAYGTWAPSMISGVEVGRVVLIVSKHRLAAGIAMRERILITAGVGCFIALGLCLLFVSMYLGPILAVTEQAFIQLEQTTEQALAAARSKSQFLANMSHEIRTPMNGILGVLDLINRTDLNAKQYRYVQIIESSARGLLTIINDVLDFSKLEAGKYDLRADEVELRQMVQEAAELLSPKAHDKGIELITQFEPAVPQTIVSDHDRIKQVLHNLIGNAIKFTDHGHVELRVSVKRRQDTDVTLCFAVTDTGEGISREDQARLFAVFTQVDGSMTRKHGGTGLGLAISKQLATALGGEIGVESEPGRGSTFWFTIATRAGETTRIELASRVARLLVVCPGLAQSAQLCELTQSWGMTSTVVRDVGTAAEYVVDANHMFDVVLLDGALEQQASEPASLLDLCLGEALPVIHLLATAQIAQVTPELQRNYLLKPLRVSELYNALINVLDGGTVQQRVHKSAGIPRRNSVTPRRQPVLVVDDNEINRVVACELLNELGYPADIACNGLEAVEKARTGSYSVVLMDCQMPELDGYEASRRIRALPPPACTVPIIALTAHALAGDRDRVLSAGMDDYTTKPIRARTLEQLLRRWDLMSAEVRLSLREVVANKNAVAGLVSVRARPAEDLRAAEASLRPPAVDGLQDLDPSLPRSPAVIELFLSSVPALLESLRVAMEREDMTNIKLLAHKLKGNCLSLGANKLAAVCHAIETAAVLGQAHHEACASMPDLYAVVSSRLEVRRSQTAASLRSGARNG
jgi:signal transduction histidine kinase/CheY-like chemotaxis protein